MGGFGDEIGSGSDGDGGSGLGGMKEEEEVYFAEGKREKNWVLSALDCSLSFWTTKRLWKEEEG